MILVFKLFAEELQLFDWTLKSLFPSKNITKMSWVFIFKERACPKKKGRGPKIFLGLRPNTPLS